MSDDLQHKVLQQKLMLEQQEMIRQEELLRLQQTAMAEKQREDQELFQLQQKALIEQQDNIQTVQVVAVTAASTIPTAILTTATLDFSPVTANLPVTLNVSTIQPTSATVVTSLQQPATLQVIPIQTTVAMPPPPGIDMVIGPPGVDPEPSSVINLQVDTPTPSVVVQAPPTSGESPDNSQEQQQQPPPQRELRLPVALEQALAFKTERAKQLGMQPEEIESRDSRNDLQPMETSFEDFEDEDDYDWEDNQDENSQPGNETGKEKRASKNKRKKKRKKRAKQQKKLEAEKQKVSQKDDSKSKDKSDKENEDVEIEYIQETLGLHQLEPMYRQFARIFETFRISEPVVTPDISKDLAAAKELGAKALAATLRKVPKLADEYEEDEPEEQEGKEADKKPKMSKRKMKKLTRLSVAELKQLVSRPDVVEMHDVTARDPKLLVQLKAHRNTVPVPRHWCFKRKYLQGKRGIEKPPFDLPEFIKKTGIMEMRASLQEKEDQRTLKAKMRERARPKLGKIDIDYQKLHDAFFKWQTKPRLTIHGDLYYEGKEFETRLKEKKPGDLSDELRTALGMPVGANAHKVPPPWLIAMQRYGPPPSYPNLKIPGLNAPIPEGCSFGYHAGGWGKPPVDESGKPLYGDVFGTSAPAQEANEVDEEVDKTAWGELESESEEESEEEEEEEEGEGEEQDQTGLVTPAEGLVTPSGITSIPAGLETPEIIELRKKKIESEMEGNETPALFQVLAEKRVDRVGGAMMASTHVYDVAGAAAGTRRSDTVELALDPSELDLVDTDAMAQRYEQTLRQQQSQLQKEDLSDMLAEHVARQKNKRKKQQSQENKQAKKYKEFKF
ncbi:splicing factor 3B subunit 2-like [Macrosteles quadrilineatus]|uniref:splicing factor 3B subunit 2-like n=1 Tax=Macrosteles quadrilineatus TaxID=74068 RepID=UPI0023E0E422|nr:splicing factor 3B subunit 2-like [Macrosteles quadrilineatus]